MNNTRDKNTSKGGSLSIAPLLADIKDMFNSHTPGEETSRH